MLRETGFNSVELTGETGFNSSPKTKGVLIRGIKADRKIFGKTAEAASFRHASTKILAELFQMFEKVA